MEALQQPVHQVLLLFLGCASDTLEALPQHTHFGNGWLNQSRERVIRIFFVCDVQDPEAVGSRDSFSTFHRCYPSSHVPDPSNGRGRARYRAHSRRAPPPAAPPLTTEAPTTAAPSSKAASLRMGPHSDTWCGGSPELAQQSSRSRTMGRISPLRFPWSGRGCSRWPLAPNISRVPSLPP